ncbi:MAG: hypothetical protein LBS86_00455 [Treponema sp.]|jgi:hypothetical protein|nr:hypothetical protein [Treponema sp.]
MKIGKKILVTFITFLILGGAAFFFGWAQLFVPPYAYGVMRSKTHGIDPAIIQAGYFRWVWYKLIPTNVEIQNFTIDKQVRTLTTKETLPSGAEYATFAGSSAEFSYELNGTLSFNIKPESLISLVRERHINNQEDLDVFEATLADDIRLYAFQRLRIYMEDERRVEELIETASVAQLNSDITLTFPDIEQLSVLLYTRQFPDIALYREYRGLYQEYIARQRDYLHTEQALQANSRIGTYIRFDDLTKYGELLTKYPMLLQFMELEARLPQKDSP